MAISVVIPNFNGRELLDENLPSLCREMRSSGMEHEIIVVDDGSTDGSAERVRERFPEVRLIRRPDNKGFSVAANEGARASKYDLLLLLNSDVRVTEGFLKPMLRHFDDPKVFAVADKTVDANNRDLTRPWYVEWRCGFLREIPLENTTTSSYAFGASGGHSVFDRRKFLELGGFDEIFSPFYWEDADLGYRAWKRGYILYYEPASAVYHRHMATIGTLNRNRVRFVFYRNYFTFLWKNISSPSFLFMHALFLPAYLAYQGIRYPVVILSFVAALARLPAIMRKKTAERPFCRRSDREVFSLWRTQCRSR